MIDIERRIWERRRVGSAATDTGLDSDTPTRAYTYKTYGTPHNDPDTVPFVGSVGVGVGVHPENGTGTEVTGADPGTPESPSGDVCSALRCGSEQPTPRKAHVAHNSGNNEWYTPAELVDAARDVLGAIDLDPASCDTANAVVGATTYYTVADDGLAKPWRGRVWMNPPYGRGLVDQFVTRLCDHVEIGAVTEAIVLVNNATETKWFCSLLDVASAMCLPTGRIRFWNPEKETASPLQGQALVYVGPNPGAFTVRFGAMGKVMLTPDTYSALRGQFGLDAEAVILVLYERALRAHLAGPRADGAGVPSPPGGLTAAAHRDAWGWYWRAVDQQRRNEPWPYPEPAVVTRILNEIGVSPGQPLSTEAIRRRLAGEVDCYGAVPN